MTRKTLIVLAAVCLAIVVAAPYAAAADTSTDLAPALEETDRSMQCIAVNPHVFPPVYWYDCG